MKRYGLVAACTLLLVVAGCKPVEDYKAGKETPLQEHEISPTDQAKQDAEPIKNLPYGNVAYPVVAAILGAWYTERRGARIRQGLPASVRPFTGALGDRVPVLEGLMQTLSNFSTGLFTLLGKQETGMQRAWKIAVSFGLATVAATPTIPGFQEWLAGHANYALALVGLAGFFGAVNVELNKVKPVAEVKPPVS